MEVTNLLYYAAEANLSITNEKNGYEKVQKSNPNTSVSSPKNSYSKDYAILTMGIC
jgi:hypothetical protein